MNFKDLKTMTSTSKAKTEELTIDEITFEWIEQGHPLETLNRAVRILQDDGDHFKELKQALLSKIAQMKGQQGANFGTPQRGSHEKEKEKAAKEISDWVMVDSPSKEQEQRKQDSEHEKNKGNDALRAGDLNEAIEHYRKAVQIDNSKNRIFCCK